MRLLLSFSASFATAEVKICPFAQVQSSPKSCSCHEIVEGLRNEMTLPRLANAAQSEKDPLPRTKIGLRSLARYYSKHHEFPRFFMVRSTHFQMCNFQKLVFPGSIRNLFGEHKYQLVNNITCKFPKNAFCMHTLMDDIRSFGRLPRLTKKRRRILA